MKSSSTPHPRPSYEIVDADDREAQLSSMTDTLSKSFATDLWVRVITRAIDDVAQFEFMRRSGAELREEDIENEESALGFLFDPDYSVPMDDYLVDVVCPKCQFVWSAAMSIVASIDSVCPQCNCKTSWKYITYTITANQIFREISLEDLVALWGVEDIEAFRIGCRKNIERIVLKKLKSHK